MGKSNKKINEKLCYIYGRLCSFFKKLNNFNTLNNQNTMQQLFVIPGHYKRKGTPEIGQHNQDTTIDIIRVLGEDPDKPDYFIIQGKVNLDGTNESLHESVILHQYDLIKTIASDKDVEKKLPAHLLAGIGESDSSTSEVVQQVLTTTPVTEEIKIQAQQILTPVNTPIIQAIEQPKYTQEEMFTVELLEKLKQPTTNKISVTIDIDIPYDINKLRNSIDLLNLDKATIIKYLMNELDLISNVKTGLNSSLINQIENPIQNEIQQLQSETISSTIVPVIDQRNPKYLQDMMENEKLISDGMSEIDEKMRKFTSNIL